MPRLSAAAPYIHPGCSLEGVSCGAFVEIGAGSRLSNSVIGDYSYCDRFSDIANADVGKFANIAAFTRIGATDHPLDTATMHHFTYRSPDYWDDTDPDRAFFDRRLARRASIGHDTWIGHGAMVKPGVTLGHGAVAAAGAIVTRDVAPFTIVAGAPAKVLRLRQPPEIADRLIALAWWDWSHDRLRAALPDFRALPAADFLARYEG